jgi:hypothetical protein
MIVDMFHRVRLFEVFLHWEMLFWHHFGCPTTIFTLSFHNLIFYYFIVSHILPKLSTLTTILVVQISLLFEEFYFWGFGQVPLPINNTSSCFFGRLTKPCSCKTKRVWIWMPLSAFFLAVPLVEFSMDS